MRDRLPLIQAPTIVFHARKCANVPIAEGRAIAEGIAGARFVELESANEVPLAGEQAWRDFVDASRQFLATVETA